MSIPTDIVFQIIFVVVSFIFGTLWGHHTQIGKRVTYSECTEKQHSCPCVQKVEELKETVEKLHPHSK